MELKTENFQKELIYLKGYFLAIPILLFVTYPIAIFIPVGYGKGVFDFFLPTFLLAAILSLMIIINSTKSAQPFSWVERLFFIILIFTTIAGLVNNSPVAQIIQQMGIALIPMAIALAYQHKPKEFSKIIQISIFLLWFLNIIHCYHRFPSINILGIAGNKNWLSALILATSPIVILFLNELLSKWLKNIKLIWLISLLFTATLAIPIIINADSRASYLSLLLLPIYILFVNFGKKTKWGIIAFLVLAIAVSVNLFEKEIAREKQRNIRFDLWSSTTKMILDNPIGFGVDHFEYSFPSYATMKQKKMLVTAETSEHTHNEFLQIAVENGILTGLAWLIICGIALFGKMNDKKELFFRIPLFILFVQGMMDKPLVQQPTMLIFYLLLGVCLAQQNLSSLGISANSSDKNKWLKKIACGFILAVGIFLSFKISLSSWYERKGIMAEAGNKVAALKYFEDAHQLAPWRILPAYKAFIISTIDIKNSEIATKYYEILEPLAPNYRLFNLVKGHYFTLLALQSPNNFSHNIEAAWENFNTSCHVHPNSIFSFTDRFNFACRFLPPNEIETTHAELLELYRFKAHASASELKIDLKTWGENWLKNKNYSDFQKASMQFIAMFKPPYLSSQTFPNQYSPLLPIMGGDYNLGDMFYTLEIYNLAKSLAKSNFVSKIDEMNKLIQIDETLPFTLPIETLNNKKGNSFAKLALLATYAKFENFTPLIEPINKKIILKKGALFFQIKQNELQEMSADQFLKELTTQNWVYFAYPQEFFFKNELLTTVLNEAEVTPFFNKNPDYHLFQLKKSFPGNNLKVSIATEPLELLMNRLKNGAP